MQTPSSVACWYIGPVCVKDAEFLVRLLFLRSPRPDRKNKWPYIHKAALMYIICTDITCTCTEIQTTRISSKNEHPSLYICSIIYEDRFVHRNSKYTLHKSTLTPTRSRINSINIRLIHAGVCIEGTPL